MPSSASRTGELNQYQLPESFRPDDNVRSFGSTVNLRRENNWSSFEIHKHLADTYLEQEAYKEANSHLKAYYEYRHEIFNERISTQINSIKTSFKLEQAQKDAEFAKLKNLELHGKNQELERLLAELKSAQSKLLHAEKLASLGELTAGIAHEIKNPLNFVNNFAALSTDILMELKDVFEERREERIGDVLIDVQDLLDDLYFNAGKINEHGKRADRIIQSMLVHARGKKEHHQVTDVNRVLMEYTKLAQLLCAPFGLSILFGTPILTRMVTVTLTKVFNC